MRARDLLRDNNIHSVVKRIPGRRGRVCSYGLMIPKRLEEAVEILRAENIKIIGRASGYR